MTYSEWVSANTKLGFRPFIYDGYEFQRRIIDDMHPDLSVIKPSQTGMALSVSTPIPTPSGWTNMGNLRVGDVVFDELGNPSTITYVSPIYTDHVCYRLTFDDGQEIIADAGHRWFVSCDRPLKDGAIYPAPSGRPNKDLELTHEGVLTTEMISRDFKRGNRNLFAVHNTAPLVTADADLPLDPYFLGMWLGDGNTHACVLTAHSSDLPFVTKELTRRGFVVLPSSQKGDTTQVRVHFPDQIAHPGRGKPNSVSSKLNGLHLLGREKFVPTKYLRGSAKQRRELLCGLMDTDGSIDKNGRCCFHNTNPQLVSAVEELAASLGYKTHTRWREPQGGMSIQSKKNCAEVSFVAYAEDPVFLRPRKKERLRPISEGKPQETRRRRITNVEKVPTVSVRCISVDSPNHLYLAGRGMIPTHNTEVQIRKFLAFLKRNRSTSGIFTFPDEKMFKKNSKTRVRPVVSQPAFRSNSLEDDKPHRSMELYQIDQSFAHIMGMTEGDATSTPADILFHDELDLSDQSMIGLYQSRLQNSSFKITQKFSTPTHPGFGIDAAYQASDQHQYMVRCEACNHWQAPMFRMEFLCLPGYDGEGDLENVDPDMLSRIDLNGSYVKCESCSARLDLANPDLREWVAKFPARRGRGYRISPFSTSRLTIPYIFDQLIKMKQLGAVKGWYNTVLGETYSDGNSKLEPDVVRAVMRGPAKIDVGDSPVALGCDQGKTCHLTLGKITDTEVIPFLWEQVPSSEIKERIAQLREKYNIVCGGVDRFPYTPTAEEIRDASKRVIMPIEYRGAVHLKIVEDEYGSPDYISINRTAAIDAQVRAVQRGATSFYGYGGLEQVIIEQLCDMVRIEVDERPATWEKLTGNDHFLHSLTLMRASIKARELSLLNDKVEARTLVSFMPTRPAQLATLGGRQLARVI